MPMLKELRKIFKGSKLKDLHTRDADSPPVLSHLRELVRLSPIAATHKKESVWQCRLPPDIILYILDDFLYNQLSTIVALSSTCRSFYTFCLPSRYSQVTLNTRNRNSPTCIEAFARIAAEKPHILNFIQRFNLLDEGFMFQGSRLITVEEECLCYILTRRSAYSNLKHLELSFRVVWDLLPPPVKSACLEIFTLPSLDHISFHHMAIPTNVLGRLHGISTLEMKGEVRPFTLHDLPLPVDRTLWCTPRKLVLWDTSRTGFITTNMLLHKHSGLLLSCLEHFVVRVSDPQFSLLEAPLASCRNTLSHLELHCPQIRSTTLLQLADLSRLNTLTMSADCSMMPYGEPNVLAARNFSWVVETVSTLSTPRSVRFLTVMIRVRQFSLAAEHLPWERLDDLFEPSVTVSWPHLKKLDVRLINESKPWEKFYREGTVEKLVVPRVPNLASTDVFRISLAHDKMDFW